MSARRAAEKKVIKLFTDNRAETHQTNFHINQIDSLVGLFDYCVGLT